jgi:hypothetical protein
MTAVVLGFPHFSQVFRNKNRTLPQHVFNPIYVMCKKVIELKHHAVLVYENVLFAEGRSLAFRSPLNSDLSTGNIYCMCDNCCLLFWMDMQSTQQHFKHLPLISAIYVSTIRQSARACTNAKSRRIWCKCITRIWNGVRVCQYIYFYQFFNQQNFSYRVSALVCFVYV